jgi:uncharacterized phage-like protein YoqJ
MIVGVTGHRPNKIGGFYPNNGVRRWIRDEIRRHLLDLKPSKTISGMAIGADQDFVAVCIELKIPFVAAVPFEGQESTWPEHAQKEYKMLLELADEVVYVCAPGYSPEKMQTRNCYIVDNSDVMLAVYDGTPGGTANTVNYANEVGKKLIFINPKDVPR